MTAQKIIKEWLEMLEESEGDATGWDEGWDYEAYIITRNGRYEGVRLFQGVEGSKCSVEIDTSTMMLYVIAEDDRTIIAQQAIDSNDVAAATAEAIDNMYCELYVDEVE